MWKMQIWVFSTMMPLSFIIFVTVTPEEIGEEPPSSVLLYTSPSMTFIPFASFVTIVPRSIDFSLSFTL